MYLFDSIDFSNVITNEKIFANNYRILIAKFEIQLSEIFLFKYLFIV